MKVGLTYEVIPVKCDCCDYEWVAVLETDYIDWGNGKLDIRAVKEAECPECENMTLVIRNND